MLRRFRCVHIFLKQLGNNRGYGKNHFKNTRSINIHAKLTNAVTAVVLTRAEQIR